MTPQTDTLPPKKTTEEGQNAEGGCLHHACSGRWFKDLESLLFALDGIRAKAREEGEDFYADEMDRAAADFRDIVSQAPTREMQPVERFRGCLQNVTDQATASTEP